jgi:UDP-N-acetylmuramoylalanine--D-glutamate ligase
MRNIKEEIARFIGNRKLLILGFGKEGRSTYRLLRSYFPKLEICISDANTAIAREKELQDDPYVSWVLGEGHMKALSLHDMIFKSPGISFKEYQVLPHQQITSQTDLFINLFHDQIIGVTGTKGKSTTVSLLHHLFAQSGQKSVLVGNIGKPAFDCIDEIDDDTRIIYELSSHQLEFVTHSPHIAVFLNLFEEHLDHYVSYLDYQKAKQNITEYQKEDDVLVYNLDNLLVVKRLAESKSRARQIAFGHESCNECTTIQQGKLKLFNQAEYAIDTDKIPLPGAHNQLNVMAALTVCAVLEMDMNKTIDALYTFKPLPHRLEEVGTCRGIRFINDSIATIPEATIRAADTFKDLDILILGGYNRGIDYTFLVDYLLERKLPHLILIGEVGRLIRELLEEEDYPNPVHEAKDMDEVVETAFALGKEGSICLLSPAASSYDSFHNFEDRGNQFKKKVLAHC